MTLPTIHLNGTARCDLHKAHMDAYHAVLDAIEKVKATAPNGRDYYPQGEAMIIQASMEHKVRMKALHDVFVQLEELACHTMA